MSEDDLTALQERLEGLVSLLPSVDWKRVHGSPQIRQLLEHVVTALADADLLMEFGHFTIEQVCTRICDVFQERKMPLTKSFSHCGRDHSYHILQAYETCPVCKLRVKTSGLFGEDNMEDVARSALLWLRINPISIRDWNSECDEQPRA